MLTGQFCHGHAWGPWTAVAWRALNWHGPIRKTFPMVSSQLPTWMTPGKKYLDREKLSASMANCQAFCYFRAKIAVKRGLTISRRIFCHPPEAFCCFRAKTSSIHGKVIVVFVCESFIKTSVVHSLLFFRSKTLVIRGMRFAVYAPILMSSATSSLLFWHQKTFGLPSCFVTLVVDFFQNE